CAGLCPNAQAGLAADVSGAGIDDLVTVWNQNAATSNQPCLAPRVVTFDGNAAETNIYDQTPCETQVTQFVFDQTALLSAGQYFAGAAQGAGQQMAMAWNVAPQTASNRGDNACLRIWDNNPGSYTLTRKGIDCSITGVANALPSGSEQPDSIPGQLAV